MKPIELSGADQLTIARCLTEGTEPPAELAKKLFPSFYADWDFKTLRDAKIPTIEYQGKRPEAAILNEASIMGAACPLQLERCFDGGKINKKATQLMYRPVITADLGRLIALDIIYKTGAGPATRYRLRTQRETSES